jgi:hypothetical protein
MIQVFCAALGTVLCALGLMGIVLGWSAADTAAQFRGILPYDALYLVSGIVAFLGMIGRRWIARRLCAAIGAVHGAIVVLGLAVPTLDSRLADLCVSAVIAMSCFAATSRARAMTRRPRRAYGRFDDRLTMARESTDVGN